MAGFEDGVVRFLELYKPETKLRLREAVKPHSAPVTALAYKQNGLVLATGVSHVNIYFSTLQRNNNEDRFIHSEQNLFRF